MGSASHRSTSEDKVFAFSSASLLSAVCFSGVDGDDSKRMATSRSMSIQTTTSQLQQQRRPKFTPQEISAQLQQLHLFSSLSSSSNTDHIEQLGPILLNIHRSRQQDAYLKALKEFVAEKEAEIEAVCTRNYQVRNGCHFDAPEFSHVLISKALQDFVSSVSALLRVRQGTVSLKHRVVELNEDVQKSGGGVADKVRSMCIANEEALLTHYIHFIRKKPC